VDGAQREVAEVEDLRLSLDVHGLQEHGPARLHGGADGGNVLRGIPGRVDHGLGEGGKGEADDGEANRGQLHGTSIRRVGAAAAEKTDRQPRFGFGVAILAPLARGRLAFNPRALSHFCSEEGDSFEGNPARRPWTLMSSSRSGQ
jgi:hypothetical protein